MQPVADQSNIFIFSFSCSLMQQLCQIMSRRPLKKSWIRRWQQYFGQTAEIAIQVSSFFFKEIEMYVKHLCGWIEFASWHL